MSKYMEWLSSLGDSAVSAVNPLKSTSTVNPDGTVTSGSTTTISGYTIIKAGVHGRCAVIRKSLSVSRYWRFTRGV